jgi:hypothetical protein
VVFAVQRLLVEVLAEVDVEQSHVLRADDHRVGADAFLAVERVCLVDDVADLVVVEADEVEVFVLRGRLFVAFEAEAAEADRAFVGLGLEHELHVVVAREAHHLGLELEFFQVFHVDGAASAQRQVHAV